jgi:hypothetical protein
LLSRARRFILPTDAADGPQDPGQVSGRLAELFNAKT